MAATETQTPEAVKGSELATLVQNAVNSAMNTNFGGEGGKLIPFPGPSAELAQDYPVPADEVLKAIHTWTLSPDGAAPKAGEVIHLAQDKSIEIISQEEMGERLQQAEMSQVSIAGFAGSLDNIGRGLPVVGKIPWGSILVGAVPGGIASEVINGLMPPRNAEGNVNWANVLVRTAVAGVGVQFGSRLIGSKAAGFFAAGMGIFIIADIFPLDRLVANLRGLLSRDGAASAQNTRLAQHEMSLAKHSQGSEATPLDPSPGSDALETLRGLQTRRAA